MQEQKEKARKARKVTNYMGADVTVYESIDPSITTGFVGYDKLTHGSEITVLTTETELVDALTDGEVGTIIVKETPFYATMGGQSGDIGVIVCEDGELLRQPYSYRDSHTADAPEIFFSKSMDLLRWRFRFFRFHNFTSLIF